MLTTNEALSAVPAEIASCLSKISQESLERTVCEIVEAKRIYLAGAGRSALAVRGFAMRLMHLGLSSYVVGEVVTPGIKEGDLLIIVSGSGRTESLQSIAKKAKNIGARVLLVTIDTLSPIAELADCIVEIPAPSPKVVGQSASGASIQPMGSLFEQSALVGFDVVVLLLMQKMGLDSKAMFANHANLE